MEHSHLTGLCQLACGALLNHCEVMRWNSIVIYVYMMRVRKHTHTYTLYTAGTKPKGCIKANILAEKLGENHGALQRCPPEGGRQLGPSAAGTCLALGPGIVRPPLQHPLLSMNMSSTHPLSYCKVSFLLAKRK